MSFRLALLLSCSALFFSACKNNDDDTVPESQVSISGISNLNAVRGREVMSYPNVTTTGTPQYTTLSINGLPAGVSAYLEPAGGTPTFNTVLKLATAGNATPGSSSTATIKATTADGAVKSYSFTVTVTNPTDCIRDMPGNYSVNNSCPGGNSLYTAVVSPEPLIPETRLLIPNFGNFGNLSTVTAYVDCSTGTISIPQQSPGNGFTFSGSGTLTGTGFSISYQAIHPGGQPTEICTAQYNKQ